MLGYRSKFLGFGDFVRSLRTDVAEPHCRPGDVRSRDVASSTCPIDPDDFRSAVPGAAAGGARPDHCFDRPADDRWRTWWPDAPLLGGHRLPALQHGRHAALWETW